MIKDEIIDLIIRNRISSTEVADCMNKTGAISDVLPINKQKYAAGPVKWVYGYKDSNWELHEQIRDVNKGDIVLIETFECTNRAVFGSLVAKFLLFYKQASAVVVQGYLRDAHTLIKENYPIWSKGVTPLGFYNKKNTTSLDQKIINSRRRTYEGSIAVCDDSGIVIIPPSEVNKEFIEKLNAIEELEDIWFDCIDRRKWDTFDTVCLQRYLKKQ